MLCYFRHYHFLYFFPPSKIPVRRETLRKFLVLLIKLIPMRLRCLIKVKISAKTFNLMDLIAIFT